MPHRSASVECSTYPSAIACQIRVRYSDVPGTFTRVDFAAGGPDCHLVQIQPTRDGRSMEVHFTGCRIMLADLGRVLGVHEIEGENDLLSPLAGEYRQAGLFVGVIRDCLDENTLMARLRQTGRPVEFVRARPPRAGGSGTEPPVKRARQAAGGDLVRIYCHA